MNALERSSLDEFRKEVNEKLDRIDFRLSDLEIAKAVAEGIKRDRDSRRDFLVRNGIALMAVVISATISLLSLFLK